MVPSYSVRWEVEMRDVGLSIFVHRGGGCSWWQRASIWVSRDTPHKEVPPDGALKSIDAARTLGEDRVGYWNGT